MANAIKNILKAEKIENLNIFTTMDNEKHLDFNLITPQPTTKEECDPEFYATENSHIETKPGMEWYDWYKWRVANWGCKWNADDTKIKDNTVYFYTPWGAPYPIISKISKMLGDTELSHEFYDCDNFGSDVFRCIWKNGYMVKAEVSSFEWNLDANNLGDGEYGDFVEIEIWDKYAEPKNN